MKQWEISKTVYTIGDFVGWQSSKTLNLRPDFQRKSVWKKGAKSYLIDTIVRGLPIPIILIRERRESGRFEPVRDVVDGQQRLITIISYIAPELIPSSIEPFPTVTIFESHNKELAGKSFQQLPADMKDFILNYKFSVHILPSDMGDRDILEIFSRMNSTGTKLNSQELRNAEWFGEFKSSVYETSYTHYENWVSWGTFSNSHLSRMADTEFTSELYSLIINGLESKDQAHLDQTYEKYDLEFPHRKEIEKRFAYIMNFLDKEIYPNHSGRFFKSTPYFYGLFALAYELSYSLRSKLDSTKPDKINSKTIGKLISALESYESSTLPKNLAETALKRRLNNLEFRKELLDYLKTATK